MKNGYGFRRVKDDAECYCEFSGPGIPGNWVLLAGESQGEHVCRMLSDAFEAGRRDKADEIRRAIGLILPTEKR